MIIFKNKILEYIKESSKFGPSKFKFDYLGSILNVLSKIREAATPSLLYLVFHDYEEVRIEAMELLEEIKDPKAIMPLFVLWLVTDWYRPTDALKAIDRHWFKRKEIKAFVPQLIQALGKDEETSIKIESPLVKSLIKSSSIRIDLRTAKEALEKITRQSYGNDVQKWQQWWESNKVTYEKDPKNQSKEKI